MPETTLSTTHSQLPTCQRAELVRAEALRDTQCQIAKPRRAGDKSVPCVTNMFDKGRFQGVNEKKVKKFSTGGFSPARAGEYLH